MSVTHISFDSETWGVKPGSDIRSIGACVFHPPRIDEDLAAVPFGVHFEGDHTFYQAARNPIGFYSGLGYRRKFVEYHKGSRKYRLHRDPATVTWWEEQSPEARQAFNGSRDLKQVLIDFAQWLEKMAGRDPEYDEDVKDYDPITNVRLWSHGAAFDGPMLVPAYEACDLPVPWHYRCYRDTRTVFDLAGIDDHSDWLQQHPGPLGIEHHALDDAACQAHSICDAWGRILTR